MENSKYTTANQPASREHNKTMYRKRERVSKASSREWSSRQAGSQQSTISEGEKNTNLQPTACAKILSTGYWIFVKWETETETETRKNPTNYHIITPPSSITIGIPKYNIYTMLRRCRWSGDVDEVKTIWWRPKTSLPATIAKIY